MCYRTNAPDIDSDPMQPYLCTNSEHVLVSVVPLTLSSYPTEVGCSTSYLSQYNHRVILLPQRDRSRLVNTSPRVAWSLGETLSNVIVHKLGQTQA